MFVLAALMSVWTVHTTPLPIEMTSPPHYNSVGLAIDRTTGEALLVGINAVNTEVDAEWQFDTWHRVDGAWRLIEAGENGPAPRTGFRLVHDRARNQFILFGGRFKDESCTNELWIFTDSAWRQWEAPQVADVPQPRYIHGMAYDEQRNLVVLFGGRAPAPDGRMIRFNDTWEFDGESWRCAHPGVPYDTWIRTSDFRTNPPTDMPAPRYGPAMAYSAAHKAVLMFAGYSTNGHDNDLWAFDENGWRRIHERINPADNIPAPGGSMGTSMASDPGGGSVVVCGGRFANNGVWQLVNEEWKQRGTTELIGSRDDAALAFDPLNKGFVLTGGGFSFSDTKTTGPKWWVFREGEWIALEEPR